VTHGPKEMQLNTSTNWVMYHSDRWSKGNVTRYFKKSSHAIITTASVVNEILLPNSRNRVMAVLWVYWHKAWSKYHHILLLKSIT